MTIQKLLLSLVTSFPHDETHRLVTVLERHRSAIGYSLHDLKGISAAICTHSIPTDPDIPPSREHQRRLNNAMREVVKKEVLKLIHVGESPSLVLNN